MDTHLLVLGGSGFVGRAVVHEGLARGWAVTTFNRGTNAPVDPRVTGLTGDRLRPETLDVLVEDEHEHEREHEPDWDLVVDTWAGAPRAARDAAAVLAPRARRYVYISSESVYEPPPPIGADESTPTVEASPDAEEGSYPELKRGAELAILEAFGERATIARPGLILGPHEDVGRLPWWLNRIAAGGEVLAPGPRDLPLQYIDARDLARFVLDAALAGHHGALNVVSRRGHATMATLLETCRSVTGADGARFCWMEPDAVLAAGIEPWNELPIWIPPEHEFAGMHSSNVERAHDAGLDCRPLADTVADTWAWLSALDGPAPLRADREPPGLASDRERAALHSAGYAATG